MAGLAVPLSLPTLLDLKRERCRRSFYEFIKEFWEVLEPAEPYTDNWHIKALADHIQAWVEGRIKNLSIEIGPGYAKSLLFAVAAPAWSWIDYPWMRWGFSTYDAELTERDSARCRELIQSPKYQEFFGYKFTLKADRNRVKFFENTFGGSRRATSVSGGATGHRLHRFVGDDLLNATEAHSPAARRDVKNHLRAMSSRGVRQSTYGRALIGQRLAEEDAGGYARNNGFEVLCLPTEFDPPRRCATSIGFKDPRTYAGELLFPARFGPDDVAQAKRDLLDGYSAQHQQLPVPAGGGILKNVWWIDYAYGKAPAFHTILQFWDTAYTAKEHNDSSAVTTWGIAMAGPYLLDAKSFRLEMPELLEQIKTEAGIWNPNQVLIESKANGLSVIQTLEKDYDWRWAIVPITPTLDKTQRTHAIAPWVAKGLARVARSQPHAVLFLGQTDVFPAAKERDLADSGISALLHIFTSYTFGAAMAPAFSEEPKARALRNNSFNAPDHDNDAGGADHNYERRGLF